MVRASRSLLCVTMLTLAMLFVSACDDATVQSAVQRSAEPDMYDVAADDSAMNAAIADARASLNEFAAVLEAPRSGCSDFSLKVRLEDGEAVEHVWLSDPFVSAKQVGGIIANDVVDVRGYSLGERVTLDRDRVSDWMYAEDGVLQGGFTIRVLRDQMPDAEREAFDKSFPFVIE